MGSQRRHSADIWDWPLQRDDAIVIIQNDVELFRADLQVPTFRPNEIDIKVRNDELLLHCHQDLVPGRTAREICRVYALPPDLDLKTLKSTFRHDGLLQIVASKKRPL